MPPVSLPLPPPVVIKSKHQEKRIEPIKNVITPVGKRKKKTIPAALREAIWIKNMGRVFEGKCLTTWCHNTITVFDFQAGHDIPESKGGATDITNLYPICSRCNLSMSNTYNFTQWCALGPSTSVTVAPSTAVVPVPQPSVENIPVKRSWWRYFTCS